jgi:hypothetical protein
MHVIFLDFDGVLVTRHSWLVHSAEQARADPDCVRHLNRITTATQASIVVSSTWRHGKTLKGIQEILESWEVAGNVVGMTPVLRRTEGRFSFSATRGQEIHAWLEAHAETKKFVILDDDSDIAPYMHRLVKTDIETGLTEAHVPRAIEMLLF